jgi:hypothetical protein
MALGVGSSGVDPWTQPSLHESAVQPSRPFGLSQGGDNLGLVFVWSEYASGMRNSPVALLTVN